MAPRRGARLLLKMPAMTGFTRIDTPLSMAGSEFTLEVLCPNEAPLPGDRERPGEALGMAGATARWFLATGGPAITTPAELWELAYETRRSHGPAMAEGSLYVEPDFEQPPWFYENPVRAQPGLEAAPGGLCAFNDQRPDLPNGPGFAWHLRPEFSGLAAARAAVMNDHSLPVRIGILDVGFDFTHRTRPENLRLDLQRNFAEDGRPLEDASDPYLRGLLDNPGHGTGTLGLLAGGQLTGLLEPEQNTGDYLGGAPRAAIIPVRIAESVVLWRTSSFAQGLDYLIAPQGLHAP